MSQVLFRTGGDWDSTTLSRDGQECLAAQLLVQIQAGRDGYGDVVRGGIGAGGDIDAYIRPQSNTLIEEGIFPGTIEMHFPQHSVVVINNHPTFDFQFTQVVFDGRDVTDQVIDLMVNIDSINNEVQAAITLYRPHWLTADEVATFNLL